MQDVERMEFSEGFNQGMSEGCRYANPEFAAREKRTGRTSCLEDCAGLDVAPTALVGWGSLNQCFYARTSGDLLDLYIVFTQIGQQVFNVLNTWSDRPRWEERSPTQSIEISERPNRLSYGFQ